VLITSLYLSFSIRKIKPWEWRFSEYLYWGEAGGKEKNTYLYNSCGPAFISFYSVRELFLT
jgi:hypothetical protein